MTRWSRNLSKEPIIALVAVRLVTLLLEGTLVQLFEAEGADKVLCQKCYKTLLSSSLKLKHCVAEVLSLKKLFWSSLLSVIDCFL